MNQHDHDNLMFILSLSEPAMSHWMDSATTDDLKYSRELLDQAQLCIIDIMVDRMPKYNDAICVLAKYFK